VLSIGDGQIRWTDSIASAAMATTAEFVVAVGELRGGEAHCFPGSFDERRTPSTKSSNGRREGCPSCRWLDGERAFESCAGLDSEESSADLPQGLQRGSPMIRS